MHLKSSLEYRVNSFLVMFSQIFINLSELISIYILFSQCKSIGNWGFYETALMYGIILTVYSFAECFARGYDEFASLIKKGDLDRMLVRPVSIHRQIFYSKIEFTKLARVVLGLVVSIIAITHLNIEWTLLKVLVLLATYMCGGLVILGLFMIGAGVSVFTVENLEFLNIITNGSREIGFYPINIYGKWLSKIFTFIVPVACFNYLPMSYILGVGNLPKIIYALSPLMGAVFVIPCVLFLNWALKKYQSTGT